MAIMHPPDLPVAILADPDRRTEAEIFNRLRDGLDDGFHVFYRCSVAGMNGDHKVPDFVILHNKYGLLGVAVADDALPHVGTEPKALPYSPIRSALRSLIFGLKEQGIRFYIPAPCCVIFARSQREHYAATGADLDYTPLFKSDFDDLQNQIIAAMPITPGYQSSWRVPDAVAKIAPLLQVNMPLTVRAEPASAPPPAVETGSAPAMPKAPDKAVLSAAAVQFSGEKQSGVNTPPRIIYVVRAIDIILALLTIAAFVLLITFIPDGIMTNAARLIEKLKGG